MLRHAQKVLLHKAQLLLGWALPQGHLGEAALSATWNELHSEAAHTHSLTAYIGSIMKFMP